MSSDQHPSLSSDMPVPALSGELDTLLKRFVEQFAEQAAREREAAVEAARVEAAEARRLLDDDVQRRSVEAVAAARAEAEESKRAFAAEAEQRLAEAVAAARAEAEQAIQAGAATAEEATRQRIDAAVAFATSAQEARFAAALDEARGQARDAGDREVAEHEARVGEREAALVSAERLLRGLEAIDGATSLRDTLFALADAVSAESPRSMLFVVRGQTLSAWQLRGFGAAAPPASSVSLPLAAAGELATVVERGEPMQVRPDVFGSDGAEALAFAALPHSEVGLAVPVVIGARTVALVYADDGDQAGKVVPCGWPEAVQVLVRHASRCLEVLTATRGVTAHAGVSHAPVTLGVEFDPPESRSSGTGDASVITAGPENAESARRYARLLISEMKLYNEAAIRIGRHRRDLRSRLQPEIERARRLYDERGFATRDDVFEDELVRTLADGDAELLGAQPAERS